MARKDSSLHFFFFLSLSVSKCANLVDIGLHFNTRCSKVLIPGLALLHIKFSVHQVIIIAPLKAIGVLLSQKVKIINLMSNVPNPNDPRTPSVPVDGKIPVSTATTSVSGKTNVMTPMEMKDRKVF